MRCIKGRKIRNIDEKVWSAVKSEENHTEEYKKEKEKNICHIYLYTEWAKVG